MAKKTQVSPKGTLVHPWLTGRPDTGVKGKFVTKPTWRTGLALDASSSEAKTLMKAVDDTMKAALKEAQDKAETPKARKKLKLCEDKPYRMETDDDDNETGRVIFNFKCLASGVNQKTGEAWSRKVALFNAKGEPLTGDVKIGAGTVAKVSFFLDSFCTGKLGAGAKLVLVGVQIIKLVEWEADASRYGFEDESDDEDAETSETEESEDEEGEESEESEDEEKEEEKPAKKSSKKAKEETEDEEEGEESEGEGEEF